MNDERTEPAGWSYRPGSWFGVFGSATTLLLPGSEKERVGALWSAIDDGAGFDDVLDTLLASGLGVLPGFVLVSTSEGPTKILVRGASVRATVGTPDGVVELDGSTVTTWVERTLPEVTSLAVNVDGVEETIEALTIEGGLVRVGQVAHPPEAPESAASEVAVGAVAEPPTDEPAAEQAELAASGDSESGDSEPEAAPESDVDGEAAPFDDDAVTGGVVAGGLLAGGAAAAVAVGHDDEPSADPDETSTDESSESAADEVSDDESAADEPAADEPSDDEPAADEPAADEPSDAAEEQDAEAADGEAGWASEPDVVASDDIDEAPADGLIQPPTDAWPDDASLDVTLAPPPGLSLGKGTDIDATAPPISEPVPEFAPEANEVPPPVGDAPPPPPPLPPTPPPAPAAWPGGLPPMPEAPPAPPSAPVWPPEPVAGEPAAATAFVPPPPGGADHDGLTQFGVADPLERPQTGIEGQPQAPSVTSPVARLVISNGDTVEVDRVILIGRAPEARRFTSSEQPRLVTVPSPLHEISSTHVEVRPGSGADHGSAIVTDMGSTNGTVLVQPGLPPEELKPGIAVQLIPGATINMGDGVTIQVTRP